MTGSQKALKIISIIMIVFSVVVIVSGVLIAAGSALPGMSNEVLEGTDASLSTAAILVGVVGVVGGLIDLIIGLLGLRGAKNPSKIGPFVVLCILGIVLNGYFVIAGLFGGTFSATDLIEIVVICICLYLAMQVKKLA